LGEYFVEVPPALKERHKKVKERKRKKRKDIQGVCNEEPVERVAKDILPN